MGIYQSAMIMEKQKLSIEIKLYKYFKEPTRTSPLLLTLNDKYEQQFIMQLSCRRLTQQRNTIFFIQEPS